MPSSCPHGHPALDGDTHCGTCGQLLVDSQKSEHRDAPSVAADPAPPDYQRRLVALGAVLLVACIAILAVVGRDDSGTPDEVAEEPVAQSTRYGCAIEPDLDIAGVSWIDPSCTEGGVLVEYCPDVPAALLNVPAYNTVDGPNRMTRVYSVGTIHDDRVDALVTHYLATRENPSNDGAQIRCPSGATTYFTGSEWERFTDPA